MMLDWLFENELRFTVIMVVAGLTIGVGIVWFVASQEAASYRKFCDTPVTTWDAVWLDLRIDECVK